MSIESVLRHLVMVDRDALRAYTQAIDNLGDRLLRLIIESFRADHERHIEDLSAALSRLGERAPGGAHIEGFAIAGFTRLAAGMGRTAGLMAMESNEVLTTQAYAIASATPLPPDIRALVDASRADEERHLQTFRSMLEESPLLGNLLSGAAMAQGLGTSMWVNIVRGHPLASALAASSGMWLMSNMFREPRAP